MPRRLGTPRIAREVLSEVERLDRDVAARMTRYPTVGCLGSGYLARAGNGRRVAESRAREAGRGGGCSRGPVRD